MSRATWGPEDRAWLAANQHGLPPASPYRHFRSYGIARKDSGRPAPDPWLTPEYRATVPCAQATRTELALRWLEEQFA